MGVPDSIKKKLAETKSTGGGAFLEYGTYLLMLKKWIYHAGFEGISDVHEFVVLKSEKKVVQEGDKTVDRAPNPVNSMVSYVVPYFGNSKVMAEQNTTKFFLGFFGLTDDKIGGEEKVSTIDECTADPQPCRGMIIGCEVYPKKKRDGAWIALPNWIHIAKPGAPGENSAEEAAKRWKTYEDRLRSGAAA